MTDIAPDEAKIRIPRVCIMIPGIHSRQKLEPRYALPLFKAMWKDTMRDPTDTVRIIDMPPNLPASILYRELPAESAERDEESRLRSEFGLHPKTQEPWFDHVYPGDTFHAAFQAALKDTAVSPAGSAAIDALLVLPGIDRVGANKLVQTGIYSVTDVARCDPERLIKLLGKSYAEKAQAAAIAAIDAPAAAAAAPVVAAKPAAPLASVVPAAKPKE